MCVYMCVRVRVGGLCVKCVCVCVHGPSPIYMYMYMYIYVYFLCMVSCTMAVNCLILKFILSKCKCVCMLFQLIFE